MLNSFKKLIKIRIIRFLIAGGSAFVVEYSLFLFFISIKTPLVAANTISFCLGLITSYTLNRIFVFQNKEKVTKQFALYLAMALVNLVISNVLLWVGVHSLNMMPFVSKIVSMILIALWNYVIFSRVIFIVREGITKNGE